MALKGLAPGLWTNMSSITIAQSASWTTSDHNLRHPILPLGGPGPSSDRTLNWPEYL